MSLFNRKFPPYPGNKRNGKRRKRLGHKGVRHFCDHSTNKILCKNLEFCSLIRIFAI